MHMTQDIGRDSLANPIYDITHNVIRAAQLFTLGSEITRI